MASIPCGPTILDRLPHNVHRLTPRGDSQGGDLIEGIRTVIADPVRNRRWDKLEEAERRALRTAQRTTRSASERALMRKRGELGERSFVQVLDHGGARRTTLRGWENIRKRYMLQAVCANLALLLRHRHGIGTLRRHARIGDPLPDPVLFTLRPETQPHAPT